MKQSVLWTKPLKKRGYDPERSHPSIKHLGPNSEGNLKNDNLRVHSSYTDGERTVTFLNYAGPVEEFEIYFNSDTESIGASRTDIEARKLLEADNIGEAVDNILGKL